MLDAIIENERKYVDAMEPEEHKSEVIDAEAAEVLIENAGNDKKALKRRVKFFTKVHERNVKLLFLVLNEVAECRSMVDSTCINGQELSADSSFASEMTETGRFLSVLKESNEELLEVSSKRRCSNGAEYMIHRIDSPQNLTNKSVVV